MFDAGKTRMIGLPYDEKNCDNMLSRFHLIPERDGQTDRRTDRRTELLYHYRSSVCWRAIKILRWWLLVDCMTKSGEIFFTDDLHCKFWGRVPLWCIGVAEGMIYCGMASSSAAIRYLAFVRRLLGWSPLLVRRCHCLPASAMDEWLRLNL